eukprot:9841746-Alexandrium_andersonii.AAC.1
MEALLVIERAVVGANNKPAPEDMAKATSDIQACSVSEDLLSLSRAASTSVQVAWAEALKRVFSAAALLALPSQACSRES